MNELEIFALGDLARQAHIFIPGTAIDVNARVGAAVAQHGQNQAQVVAARQRGVDAVAEAGREFAEPLPQRRDIAFEMRGEGQVFLGRRRIGLRRGGGLVRELDGLAMVDQADAVDQGAAAIGRGLEDILVDALPVRLGMLACTENRQKCARDDCPLRVVIGLVGAERIDREAQPVADAEPERIGPAQPVALEAAGFVVGPDPRKRVAPSRAFVDERSGREGEIPIVDGMNLRRAGIELGIDGDMTMPRLRFPRRREAALPEMLAQPRQPILPALRTGSVAQDEERAHAAAYFDAVWARAAPAGWTAAPAARLACREADMQSARISGRVAARPPISPKKNSR